MIWYVLLILIVLFLLWLLFGPVILLVNTTGQRYQLSLPGIFLAVLVPSDGLFHVRGRILFFPYKFFPFRKGRKKKREKKGAAIAKRRFRFPRGGFGMARDMAGTIRIKHLEMDIDTDDFLLNGWLVPVFSVIDSSNTRMHVNFEGVFTLLVDMRIRLGVLLWAFIRNRYKLFINH